MYIVKQLSGIRVKVCKNQDRQIELCDIIIEIQNLLMRINPKLIKTLLSFYSNGQGRLI